MMSKRDICRELFACPPPEELKEIVALLDSTEEQLNTQNKKVGAFMEEALAPTKPDHRQNQNSRRGSLMPELNDSGVLSYSVRTLFNEETTVEREIIEHLAAAKLGWTWWPVRDFLKVYRPDESEVLLLPLLREKLKALNPAVLTNDAQVDAIITKLRGCRDNQQWLAWLKDGVQYKFDAAENAQDVRLIDYGDIDANDWWVTNQFSIDGKSTRRRHRAADQRHPGC